MQISWTIWHQEFCIRGKMKRFQILRVDNDLVEKVDLRLGDNIIGRNVPTGRDNEQTLTHAVTINVAPDDEMTITPHQVTPCYMRSAGTSQWKLLELGTAVSIKPGDVCSLVPDKCCFKVISVSNKMSCDNEEHVLKRKANEDLDTEIADKKFCSGEGDISESSNGALSKLLNDDRAAEIHTEEDVTNGNNSYCDADESVTSNMEHKSQESHHSDAAKDETCEHKNGGSVDNKSTIHKDNTLSTTDTKLPSTSENNNDRTMKKDKRSMDPTNSHDSHTSTNTKVNVSRREKCKYAEKCYRKSREHKVKYSHPCDSDYDIPDDREECPYGKKCYRKNPQHKLQYKHTSKNVARKPKKQKRKQAEAKESLDTLSELEDSSPEESIDESEYEPSSDGESSDDNDYETYTDKSESETGDTDN